MRHLKILKTIRTILMIVTVSIVVTSCQLPESLELFTTLTSEAVEDKSDRETDSAPSEFTPESESTVHTSEETSQEITSPVAEETTSEPATSDATEVNPIKEDSTFEVHFIDVGQGDSELIICDGEAMLIDGGNASESQLIYSYLRDHNVSHLKYIINTHPDADHVGGLAGALNYAKADIAYSSVLSYDSKAFNSFLKYLDDTTLTVPSEGTPLNLGCASGSIICSGINSADANDNSLVIRLEYGNTSFLFMGDADSTEEQAILDSGKDISSTVLKIGHHGSSNASTIDFLQAVSPQYSVISCGANNSYLHPTNQTLERLASIDTILFRTDIQGHIICKSDGHDVSFTTEKNYEANTFATYAELYIPETTIYIEPDNTDNNTNSDEHTYMLNTRSKKIHTMDCASVARMSEQNKYTVTGTLEEILEKYDDYSVCGNCHAQY